MADTAVRRRRGAVCFIILMTNVFISTALRNLCLRRRSLTFAVLCIVTSRANLVKIAFMLTTRVRYLRISAFIRPDAIKFAFTMGNTQIGTANKHRIIVGLFTLEKASTIFGIGNSIFGANHLANIVSILRGCNLATEPRNK
jgi:hypothetical protein